MSHSAKVPAQPIANNTTKGAGSSCKRPLDFKIARAMPATAMPKTAQTIHEGKYDPKIFLDGAPLQPTKLNREASARRCDALLKIGWPLWAPARVNRGILIEDRPVGGRGV
jgi:hypothetical protein